MKRLFLANGEVRNGREFIDLSEDEKNKVICEWIQFEIETMHEGSPYYYLAEKMDKMRTPWFLGEAILEKHKGNIIETIEINDYLFDDDAEMLPVLYHIGKNNQVTKTTFGKNQVECKIESIH